MSYLYKVCFFVWVATWTSNVVAATTDSLMQQSDLQYIGAFRLPFGNFSSPSGGFAYGGTALAYNPANNSLFVVGHDWHQMVAEVGVPQIVNSSTLSSLKTATVLQNFVDATEGKKSAVQSGGTIKIGGLLVSNGKLYITAYDFYDASGSQATSHFSRPLNLSTKGQVAGPVAVGTVGAGFVSGYMADIPASWQSSFGASSMTGNCCLNIISRTSSGPAIFAFSPSSITGAGTVSASPMVYYPLSNPLATWNTTNSLFNGTTEIHGVVFPEKTRSVLFIGRHGTGTYCYGEVPPCNDPESISKGNHAYPYQSQIWAYDANQLLSVKNGQTQPWSVKPYGVWEFNTPFDGNKPGGVAYDAANGRVFMIQRFGDGELPVVLVYKAGEATGGTTPPPTASAPTAPSNLGIK